MLDILGWGGHDKHHVLVNEGRTREFYSFCLFSLLKLTSFAYAISNTRVLLFCSLVNRSGVLTHWQTFVRLHKPSRVPCYAAIRSNAGGMMTRGCTNKKEAVP
jgi:hypothetical protein